MHLSLPLSVSAPIPSSQENSMRVEHVHSNSMQPPSKRPLLSSPPFKQILTGPALTGAFNPYTAFGCQYNNLLMSRLQYSSESGVGACKRVLYQAELLAAVEAEDEGDEEGVERCITEWREAYERGRNMFPLVYRHGVFDRSPLSIAVAYKHNRNNLILKMLLTLPYIHIQAGARQSNNIKGNTMLE